MRHYVVGEWADFIRNLVGERERIEMEQHRVNCAECQATVEFLQKVAAVAQAEHLYESASKNLSAAAHNVFVQSQTKGGARDCAVDFQSLAAHLTYGISAHLRK